MKNDLKDFKEYKDWCKAHYLKPGTQIALEIFFIYKRSKLI